MTRHRSQTAALIALCASFAAPVMVPAQITARGVTPFAQCVMLKPGDPSRAIAVFGAHRNPAGTPFWSRIFINSTERPDIGVPYSFPFGTSLNFFAVEFDAATETVRWHLTHDDPQILPREATADEHTPLCVVPPADGQPGAPGPQGPAGTTGDPGEAGPEGPRGPTGDIGPIGFAGEPGLDGPAGATGAPGVLGPSGLPGPTGATGPRGTTGATGAAGRGLGFVMVEVDEDRALTLPPGSQSVTYLARLEGRRGRDARQLDLTLPAAAGASNRFLTIRKVDNGGSVVVRTNGEQLEGAEEIRWPRNSNAVRLQSRYEYITFITDGAKWYVFAQGK